MGAGRGRSAERQRVRASDRPGATASCVRDPVVLGHIGGACCRATPSRIHGRTCECAPNAACYGLDSQINGGTCSVLSLRNAGVLAFQVSAPTLLIFLMCEIRQCARQATTHITNTRSSAHCTVADFQWLIPIGPARPSPDSRPRRRTSGAPRFMPATTSPTATMRRNRFWWSRFLYDK